jgi:O-antigen ligase
MGIPMLISILLFVNWLLLRHKVWNPQIICFFLLLVAIAVMGPFAVNTFTIWWGFRLMAVQLLCICVPMINFLNSRRKITICVNALICVYTYLAVYGLLHSGTGPGGHVGDENDLALAINTTIPLAFISIFLAKRLLHRLAFAAAFTLMVLCVIATFSRGGFLGLLPVALYCFFLSPRKGTTVPIVLSIALTLPIAIPEKYGMQYSDRIASIIAETQGQGDNVTGTGELRREHWAIARAMFRDYPIFGVGLGNYMWKSPMYQSDKQYARIGRSLGGFAAHSLYFTLLAELGIAGFLIFGAILWFNWKDIRRIIGQTRRRKPERVVLHETTALPADTEFLDDSNCLRLYAHGTLAGLLGYLTSGIFLSVFAYPHFWIFTALVAVLKRVTDSYVTSQAGNGSVSHGLIGDRK